MRKKLSRAIPAMNGHVLLYFTDGTHTEFDVTPFLDLEGMEKLSDPNLFVQVKVDADGYGLVWPGGIHIDQNTVKSEREDHHGTV